MWRLSESEGFVESLRVAPHIVIQKNFHITALKAITIRPFRETWQAGTIICSYYASHIVTALELQVFEHPQSQNLAEGEHMAGCAPVLGSGLIPVEHPHSASKGNTHFYR